MVPELNAEASPASLGRMRESGSDGLAWNTLNYRPAIINVALTGAIPRKKDFPNLPNSQREIAVEAIRCAHLGAQVFHLHMRDEHDNNTQNGALFRETILRIRDEVPEVIVCVTTSSRASSSLEDRLAPLQLEGDAKPDMASLSLGSFNFPDSVSGNSPDEIELLASAMKQRGIFPELEVFEPGMVDHSASLQRKGVLPARLVMNILLGNRGTSPASVQALAPFISQLAETTEWALAGIGRFQRKAIMLGISLGANVRVGMEDDPTGDGSESWSNASAVKLAIEVCDLAKRQIATRTEARQRLLSQD